MIEVRNSGVLWTIFLLITICLFNFPAEAKHGDGSKTFAADSDATYLLITNKKLATAFQRLVDRRTAQGFPGRLLTVENIYANYTGVDDPEKIRNCIINHYFNYGTQYVALGGDQIIVPVRFCDPGSSGAEMPADLYYADMDGSDWDVNRNGIYGENSEVNEIELTPEVHLGRIPLRTSEDATAYINKVVTYETTSPDGFANSMILFGTWGIHSGATRRIDYLHHDPVAIAEFRQMYIYYKFIQPYWQAMPLHFLWDAYSSWDTHICGDYDLTRDRLIEKINQGYHFLFYWGHGGGGWHLGGRYFMTEHAAALTNVVPGIITSFACSVASFDVSEPCLSEAFLRNPHGGAIAYFGHTRPAGGGHVNCEQFFPAMARGTDRTTGEIITEVLTTLAPQYTSIPYRQYNFVLHGDPCIQLLTEESGRQLQVFQPKGCEVIERGTDFNIRWNAAGTGFSSGEKIKLEYSPDSGQKWHPIPEAQALPYYKRLFTWLNCPLPAGSNYRIRVVSMADEGANAMSERDFTIGDLALLTVQSSPVESIAISISGSKTDDCTLFTDFNITILEGATINVSAPAVTGKSSEFAFVRWRDESGNTMATTPDYKFVLTQDKTIVAEYEGPQIEWQIPPAGWWSVDIGTTGGGVIQNGDTYEITGDGHDIWYSYDGFHYMFKELTGDGSITARVVSNGTGTNTWAKGGVMIRNEISPYSAHAMTVVTGGAGGGGAFHWRSSTSASTSSAHDPIPSVSPPYWVRVERWGNEFSGYLSADGTNWRQRGATQIISMNDTVYIGLCVTSHTAGSLRTYTFDNVSYEGLINNNLLNLIASQPTPADGTVSTNN